ncbi:unnamed protein product [Soboliphyme baturini]|uniref:RICTOR_V domain-containing protein n=1 Tax=Soboliphyme baturini TaxID=241478 RepID=A0A183J5W1_9BILA|nr:unnamed protein product [Soboliphyme baturini]
MRLLPSCFIPAVVKIAEECPVYSVRGCAIFVLNLVCQNQVGAERLFYLGWPNNSEIDFRWSNDLLSVFSQDYCEIQRTFFEVYRTFHMESLQSNINFPQHPECHKFGRCHCCEELLRGLSSLENTVDDNPILSISVSLKMTRILPVFVRCCADVCLSSGNFYSTNSTGNGGTALRSHDAYQNCITGICSPSCCLLAKIQCCRVRHPDCTCDEDIKFLSQINRNRRRFGIMKWIKTTDAYADAENRSPDFTSRFGAPSLAKMDRLNDHGKTSLELQYVKLRLHKVPVALFSSAAFQGNTASTKPSTFAAYKPSKITEDARKTEIFYIDGHMKDRCLSCEGAKRPSLERAAASDAECHKGVKYSLSTDKTLPSESVFAQQTLRREVLRLVSLLTVRRRYAERELLRLKHENPQTFSSLCLYSDICYVLSKYRFSMQSRRFSHEIFSEVDFSPLWLWPKLILQLPYVQSPKPTLKE